MWGGGSGLEALGGGAGCSLESFVSLCGMTRTDLATVFRDIHVDRCPWSGQGVGVCALQDGGCPGCVYLRLESLVLLGVVPARLGSSWSRLQEALGGSHV